MGTIFKVDGTWYIRLLGEGGNLVRLEAGAQLLAGLSEGRSVTVDGYASRDHLGRLTTVNARNVTMMGSQSTAAGESAEASWKAQVAAELQKAEPDWKIIEAASRGAIDNDPDAVRFSVDAAHIQRLGEQLVSKQETALSELIKNAFDADATKVILAFSGQSKAGGKLKISDDGVGMTETVIRSSWMRISTNNKSEEPRSPLFNRIRAGRKGIGRFSVQRLGRRLTLETRPAGELTGFRVAFNWDEAFKPGVSLSDVFSKFERFDKLPDDHGTTLEIADLRDAWPSSAIERVWKAVILLQSPFPISTVERDPGRDPERNASPCDFSRGRSGQRAKHQSQMFDLRGSSTTSSMSVR